MSGAISARSTALVAGSKWRSSVRVAEGLDLLPFLLDGDGPPGRSAMSLPIRPMAVSNASGFGLLERCLGQLDAGLEEHAA